MFNRLSSKFFFLILSIFIICLSISGLQKSKKADLVLMNGKIVTVDEAKPEVQALAVGGDRIIAVGSNEEIKPYITQKTEVIDLEGKLAIPGFIDSHGHFTGLGRSKMVLNFMEVKGWDEVVAMTKEALKTINSLTKENNMSIYSLTKRLLEELSHEKKHDTS